MVATTRLRRLLALAFLLAVLTPPLAACGAQQGTRDHELLTQRHLAVASAAAPADGTSVVGLALWLGVAALVLLAVCAGGAVWVALRARRRFLRLERGVRLVVAELRAEGSLGHGLRADVDRLAADLERLRSQVHATGTRIAGERARSEHVLEVLTALPPTDLVVTEHYVPAADPSD